MHKLMAQYLNSSPAHLPAPKFWVVWVWFFLGGFLGGFFGCGVLFGWFFLVLLYFPFSKAEHH